MTSEKLARWRAMGYDFPAYYDDIATREDERNKKAADNATITSITVKQTKQPDEKYNLIIKIIVAPSTYTDSLIVEFDKKIYNSYKKEDLFLGVAYVDLNDVNPAKTATITARLINLGIPKSEKSYSFQIGSEEKVEDRMENVGVLLTLINFTSIFGNRKLFTHKDMKIYNDVYNIDKQIYVSKLNEFFVPFQINTAIRIAHFLGQIEHESAHLSTTQEFHDGSNYENRIDLGNTEKGDGKRFRGRGLIQLTGRSNYAAYSAYYNNLNANKIDFTEEPNNMLFVSNINFAINVSCWFWINKGLNILADEDDLIFLTYKVNGGFNGYNSRKEITQKSIKKLDVIADEDLIKELGIYTVEKSKLYDNYSGIYKWARYHDEKYPKLEGTGKNKKEAKSAYQRVLYLYENDKTKKTKANLKIYKNAQNRNSIL